MYFKIVASEEPVLYLETWHPPDGRGMTRHGSAWLVRTPDRRYWVDSQLCYGIILVMDDHGFLTGVGFEQSRRLYPPPEPTPPAAGSFADKLLKALKR